MRISFLYQNMRYQETLRSSLSNLMKAGEASAEQRKVLTPEQAPAAYVAAYNLQRSLDELASFKKNSQNADGWLDAAHTQLKEAIELISTVRDDLALAGNNGTNSEVNYKALAGSVLGVYNRLMDVVNAQYLDRFLFSGYQTHTKPFEDTTSGIRSLTQYYGTGGDVQARETFNDMMEFASGEYTVSMRVNGDTGYLTVRDKNGVEQVIDSNGTDDTLKTGNRLATQLSFKIEPGAIINTGRGFSITLPDDLTGFTGLEYKFEYQAGSYASYFGDNGVINTLIGYNQTIPINFTGSELFMKSSKILKSQQLLHKYGFSATAATKFSDIKGVNTNIGDNITIKGTDHLGRPVGAASAMGTEGVKLDLSNTTAEERTLTIGYGSKFYTVEIPAQSYKDEDELVTMINRQLQFANYAGGQMNLASYANEEAMSIAHNAQVSAGLPTYAGSEFVFDLRDKVEVVRDGDRLCFSTTSVGNHNSISVTGGMHNKLGFDDKTAASFGKDTVFELGYNFKEDDFNTLSVTQPDVDIATFFSTPQQIYLNNKEVNIPAVVPMTPENVEVALDRALEAAGFNNGSVTATLTPGTNPGEYNVTFNMQNVNFDKETHLALMFDGNYQMESSPRNIPYNPQEQTIGDYMRFIKDLYGEGVDVSLEDGRIAVTDMRTGTSKMTMTIHEGNQGISLPIGDDSVIIGGKYKGYNDDTLDVRYTMTQVGSRVDLQLEVYNSQGIKVADKAVTDYKGQPVELRQGVTAVFDETSTTNGRFSVELTARPSLNLGDMNVAQEGASANMFTSLMNVYDALMSSEHRPGLGAPTAWKDTSLRSTAIPYLDGTYGGNANTTWTHEVQAVDGKTNYYLQSEFTQTTLTKNNTIGATNLDFKIQYYDRNTGQLAARNMNIAIPAGATAGEINEIVARTINTDNVFYNQGIHATVKDGAIVFESGSGTTNIAMIPMDDDTTYLMGTAKTLSQGLGDEIVAGTSFDITWHNGAAWQTSTISVPAGTYSTQADVVTAINTQLTGAGVPVSASLSDGALQFHATGGQPFYYDEVIDPNGALGIGNTTQNYITGGNLTLDMKELSVEERTLTLQADGQTFTITLDANEYANMGEVVAEVNSKLATAGANTYFECQRFGDRGLSFKPVHANSIPCSIEGDHKGTLGFKKTGDQVSLKVTDSDGKTVQNLLLKTANKEYHVADGVQLAFNPGSMYVTDSFQNTVGSGVSHELGVLDQVQSQLLQALTALGNRSSRVDSALAFNSAMTITNTKQQAVYIGATDEDQIEITANFKAAETAYQYALSITSRIMSISILDYLR